MSIPKIIYYTWVSPNPLPDKYQKFIDGWKEIMPDYEIRPITLENCPRNKWVDKAIEQGKYVLAGHFGRCERLYDTGGLYFDIDVEVIKSFDALLDNKMFLGIESDCIVNNAIMGAEAGQQFLKDCMDFMETFKIDYKDVENETGPRMFTKIARTYGWNGLNETQEAGGVKFYSHKFFYPYLWNENFTDSCVKSETYCIHRWASTWTKKPLVSVIIPCYNQAQYLDECIRSILSQTYKEVEIIVVNDGSKDNTTEVASKYPVQIIIGDNYGLSAARNRGIKLAKGEYICCLDADDKIYPTYLEKLVGLSDIACAGLQEFGDSSMRWMPDENHTELKDFIKANRIFCSAVFKREVWEKVGGYDESNRSAYEDWDFWIRAKIAGYKIKIHPEYLFYYRKHNASMTAVNVVGNVDKLYRDIIWSKYKQYDI